jgi:hypothetical protein
VAQLYLQVLGPLFVASYDSQEYGGGIRPRLHTGSLNSAWDSRYIAWGRTQQKTPHLSVPLLLLWAVV